MKICMREDSTQWPPSHQGAIVCAPNTRIHHHENRKDYSHTKANSSK